MEKKTKIILVVFFVVILVVSCAMLFVFLQGTKSDPLNNLKYVNREFEFGFNPPDGWNLGLETGGGVYFNYTTNEDNSEPLWLIVWASTPVGYKETLNSYVNQTLELLANSTLENFSLISNNERTVNGMNAYEFVSTYNYYDNQTKIKYERKVKLVYVEKNGRIFNIQYAGRPDLYDEYESVVEQSINSLTII
jgi:hypothetical protein